MTFKRKSGTTTAALKRLADRIPDVETYARLLDTHGARHLAVLEKVIPYLHLAPQPTEEKPNA